MTISRFGRGLSGAGIAIAMLAGCGGPHSVVGGPPSMSSAKAAAPQKNGERVVYNFSGGNDGGNAATALTLDKNGNVFGTTVVGGFYLCGTVFELAPQPSPPWPETVLYNFTCYADGKAPHGGVSFDAHGNLVGTTVAGGTGGYCSGDGCGVVFQLKSATERVLHNFTGGHDGFGPGGAVVFNPAGIMYGTTPDGGAKGEGTVYQVSRTGTRWRERVIHAFSGGNDGGVGGLGALLLDTSGNLYGVTEVGGANQAGTVYRMSPAQNGRWKLTTLYAFKGTPDAGSPYGGLIADTSGNLYGTTYYGGANGLGSVYELVRSGSGYHENVLYSFKGGNDGSLTTTTLIFGKDGQLYGTTAGGGGSCDCGTIFRVNAKTGKEKVLHSFGGSGDGAYSYYGLTADAHGNFYGTTVAGGRFGQGTVFEFTP